MIKQIFSSVSKILYGNRRNMSQHWTPLVQQIIPSLTQGHHKGQSGRIAIIGGSVEYTGAPYFAAISALKVGADLSHVFCTQAAAPVIKSYSPELIVHPLLDSTDPVKNITQWLDRIHVVVIGPGLGRDPKVLKTVKDIICWCRNQKKPLVIDADGLFLVTEHIETIKNYPSPGVILTPNKVEFDRLYKIIKKRESNEYDTSVDYDKLGTNVMILRKGAVDQTISADIDNNWNNAIGGSARRCGGQGDLLSGSLGTFFFWAIQNVEESKKNTMYPATIACYAASRLTRMCNEKAFKIKGRSMICTDMIEKIHEAFEELFEKH